MSGESAAAERNSRDCKFQKMEQDLIEVPLEETLCGKGLPLSMSGNQRQARGSGNGQHGVVAHPMSVVASTVSTCPTRRTIPVLDVADFPDYNRRSSIPGISLFPGHSDLASVHDRSLMLRRTFETPFAVPGANVHQIANATTTMVCAAENKLVAAEGCKHTVRSGPLWSEQCAVCHDDYVEGEELRVLPCQHKYHRDCIDKWLERSRTCPVCKHDIVEETKQHVRSPSSLAMPPVVPGLPPG
jgi:hypothetical protein